MTTQKSFGNRIRELRLAKSMTQENLAVEAGIKLSTLQKAEKGRNKQHSLTLQKIAAALNVPTKDLVGLAAQTSRMQKYKDDSTEASVVLEQHVPEIQRALLDFASTPIKFNSIQTPLTLTEIRCRIDAAYRLRQASRYTELGVALPSLLAAAQCAIHVAPSGEQQTAFTLLAEANHVAAAFLKKTARPELAWLAIDRATYAADKSESPLFQAAGAYRLANLLQELGHLDSAADIASRAIARLEGGLGTASQRYISMWGALMLKRSVIASRQGDQATLWECVGEAKAAARRIGSDRNDFWTAFGPTNVAIHEVSAAAELGEWGMGLNRAQRVDLAQMPTPLLERRAHFLIDLARCYTNTRQDDKALEALLRAESLAPEDLLYNPGASTVVSALLARERRGFMPGLRDLALRLGAYE